ncbi:MAG TPA: cobalt-precorrin-5B (C(1))-methyltransferase CbiD [Clostridia bacterium]|nr:cobalt-precorrin-5B (C(1))-methyltransferase CbiD [Clostridia bacterium]
MDLSRKNVDGKLLRCGYTTGACAAAAAKAAVLMLLTGKPVSSVSIPTPKGVLLALDVLDAMISEASASCAVKKDSGDDPDVTNGVLVYAKVERSAEGVRISGGEGVGRVTKPGLDQPVGEAAINSTPRRMIAVAAEGVCAELGYTGGISVSISVPGGKELAKRTFNPRMGIMDGISVIGTTGIVEPMSNAALIDTVRLELRQLAASGAKAVLLTPGNYGETFAGTKLGLSMKAHVACSNFIGDAIDAAVELGLTQIFLIGHIGKLVKLGVGMTNTHSGNGDGRMETLLACALEAGAKLPLLKGIMACVTTDAALALLNKAGLLKNAMEILGERIDATLKRRVPEGIEIGFLCFTNAEGFGGVLAQSENAEGWIRLWRESE